MGRPVSPKKIAAIEQVAKLREQGKSTQEIREILLDHGMTGAQVNDVCPKDKPDEEKPKEVVEVSENRRTQVIEEAVHALEYIYRELREIPQKFQATKEDILRWARKLKSVQ